MSFLVLHMDKFKKEAIRGIQSHNRRERESRSNPDIDYGRSTGNYELHEEGSGNYAQAVQNRIDDLLLVKAVRKDAVHLCGLIVSSDKAFFDRLTPEESRRFFEESKAFLTEFVGRENVVSAMVHMDEKTPHMHFLHVPVTPDGRLNANSIYTRSSLKKLQTDLPRYLQSRGFNIQRGVEQKPGSAKKHLDTREFKQQQEALADLQRETASMTKRKLQQLMDISELEEAESTLKKRLEAYEQQAWEADHILSQIPELPQASVFNYKAVLQTARDIIRQQKKALAEKHLIAEQRDTLRADKADLEQRLHGLSQRLAQSEKTHTELKASAGRKINELHKSAEAMRTELEDFRKLVTHPRVQPLYIAFCHEREEKRRREAAERQRLEEQQRQEQERQQELESRSQGRPMRMR